MRKSKRWIAMAALAPAVAGAQSMDINASSDSLTAAVEGQPSWVNDKDFRYHMGFIYNDDVANSTFGTAGVQWVKPFVGGAPGITVGVDLTAYVGDVAGFDTSAVAVGVIGRYIPPVSQRLSFDLNVRYAPEIVSFNDADGLTDVALRGGYEVVDNTVLYLGYRKIETELTTGEEVDSMEGVLLGVEFPL